MLDCTVRKLRTTRGAANSSRDAVGEDVGATGVAKPLAGFEPDVALMDVEAISEYVESNSISDDLSTT